MKIKHWFQRKSRGFDDSEWWDIEISFVEWIIPRLKVFRKKTNGWPGQLEGKEISFEEWMELLDTMIAGFEARKEMDNPENDSAKCDHLHGKYEDALDLFRKYINHLWD